MRTAIAKASDAKKCNGCGSKDLMAGGHSFAQPGAIKNLPEKTKHLSIVILCDECSGETHVDHQRKKRRQHRALPLNKRKRKKA